MDGIRLEGYQCGDKDAVFAQVEDGAGDLVAEYNGNGS